MNVNDISKNLTICVTLAILTLSTPVQAAIHCTGKVDNVATSANGNILFSIAGQTPIHTVCNIVDQGAFETLPQACKAMYATLLAARLAERQVRVYYSSPALTSCTQITSWSIQTGFYFVEMP